MCLAQQTSKTGAGGGPGKRTTFGATAYLGRGVVTILLFTALLTSFGCARAKFACTAPDPLGCLSITEVYRQSIEGDLQPPRDASGASSSDQPAANNSLLRVASVAPGAPVRRPPETLRVLVTPWPDADGDLHSESYVFLVLHDGEWVIPTVAVEPAAAQVHNVMLVAPSTEGR